MERGTAGREGESVAVRSGYTDFGSMAVGMWTGDKTKKETASYPRSEEEGIICSL